jgi:hypothetical protein
MKGIIPDVAWDVLDGYVLPEGWGWVLRSKVTEDENGKPRYSFAGSDSKGNVFFEVEGAVFLPAPTTDKAAREYLNNRAGGTIVDTDFAEVEVSAIVRAAVNTVKHESEQHRGEARKRGKAGEEMNLAEVQQIMLGLTGNVVELSADMTAEEKLDAILKQTRVRVVVK